MSPAPVDVEAAPMDYVVKNTFICVSGGEAMSPPSTHRSRAKTIGDMISRRRRVLSDESQSEAGFRAPSPVEEEGPEEDTLDEPPAAATIAERAFDQVGGPALAEELATCDQAQARIVANGLRGMAGDASRSPHAHLALLELIRLLGAEDAAFIPQELAGEGRRTASNVHGHVVLCALLRRWPGHPATAALVDEVLADDAASVCCHKFGYNVAIEVLAHGLTAQRGLILTSLTGHVQRFARHRFASQVLERALQQSTAPPGARECLVAELIRHPGGLANLACHCFGTHIVRTLLRMPGTGPWVYQTLLRAEHRLQKDRYGMKLLQEALPGVAVAAASAVVGAPAGATATAPAGVVSLAPSVVCGGA